MFWWRDRITYVKLKHSSSLLFDLDTIVERIDCEDYGDCCGRVLPRVSEYERPSLLVYARLET